MGPAIVVLLLTLLLGIQPVTTDLYLPALPTLQRDLGASMAATQLTLSALIICFGAAQLILGPCPIASAAARCCWPASRSTRSPAWRPRWRQRWAAGGVARAAGRQHGRRRDLRPLHRARPVRAPHEGARDVKGAQRAGPDRDGQPGGGGVVVVARLARGAAGAGAVRRRGVAWWPGYEETVPQRNPRATQCGGARGQLARRRRTRVPRLDAAVGLRLRRAVLPARRHVVRHIGLLGTSKGGLG